MAVEFGLGFPSGLFDFEIGSIVDDTLANTSTLFDDCDYGVVQMQKTEEKSPFHESDSGVSEVSDKTQSPSWEMDFPLLDDNFLDGPTGPFLTSSIDRGHEHISQDEDLINYLQSGASSDEQTVDVNNVPTKQVTASRTSYRVTRSQAAGRGEGRDLRSDHGFSFQTNSLGSVNRNKAVGMAKNQYHDSASDDDSETDIMDSRNPVEFTSVRKPKGSVRVKEAGVKLPSSSSSEKTNVTSVKVLRIVKSGSEENTEDDVVKALEERNRKNAEMARQNRLKKKAYVGNLEREVEDGRKRIDELETALNDVEEERDSYKREVEYLKSVLANQSALAGLLKNIPAVKGVTLSSSVSRKRVAELDHSYTPMKKSRPERAASSSSKSGVCLHVNNDNVSLEFCHHCANMSSSDGSS